MRRLRSLVEELCAALAAFDPALLPGEECAALAEVLTRAAKLCDTGSARAAARAVECGKRGGEGDATTVEWLARVGGSSTGAVRAALATVKQVEDSPATQAALLAGEVSLEQAAEVVSVPGHEAELLEMAKTSGLRPVKDLARKRRCEGITPEELYARQRAAREFKHWRDELGMIRFRGALPPDTGISFVNRLDAQTDREWRTARREGRREARSVLAADAFVKLTSTVGAPAGKSKPRPRSADLVLVADLNAYRRGHTHEGEISHIVGGGPIPVSVARALEKDAFLKVVLHDGVNIHTVAHFGRHRPAQLETALMLGAPPEFEGVTCAEIGCDRRFGLEWDHVDPRANGGETSLANLKPKCKPPLGQNRARPQGRIARRRRSRQSPVIRRAVPVGEAIFTAAACTRATSERSFACGSSPGVTPDRHPKTP